MQKMLETKNLFGIGEVAEELLESPRRDSTLIWVMLLIG